jgi:hypothetical protein
VGEGLLPGVLTGLDQVRDLWMYGGVNRFNDMDMMVIGLHGRGNPSNMTPSHNANGGVIPGNSMSGDNLRGITPDGTVYGLNSQEIILNRAQQGNLASQLEGGSMQNLNIDWVLTGDKLRAVLNNNGRRTGRGELVQRNRI